MKLLITLSVLVACAGLGFQNDAATSRVANVQRRPPVPAPGPAPAERGVARPSVSSNASNTKSASTSAAYPPAAFLRIYSKEIKERSPSVPNIVLEKDMLVITEALPRIEDLFLKRGFQMEDAHRATAAVWRDLRSGPNSLALGAELSATMVLTAAKRRGVLSVNTDPRNADIEIDGLRQKEKTKTDVWLGPGWHTVRVSKGENFEPIQTQKKIEIGKVTVFNRRLRRKRT